MIEALISREPEMLAAARAIEDGISSGRLQRYARQPDEVDETGVVAIEGRLLVRQALVRERSPKLRRLKIKQVKERGEPLRCEVCGFDFGRAYGGVGDGYIEVHHVTPLHAAGPSETSLDGLACLCANCHRMCHRVSPGKSWRTPEEPRGLMRTSASGIPRAAPGSDAVPASAS
ncbi:HNH endonuclease [Streptomyces sp. PmtG]